MCRFAQVIRIATALAVVFVLAVALTSAGPAVLSGQEGGDSCPEESEEELGPCTHLQHVFLGDCEGSTCWTAQELCCLPELVLTIQ